MRSVHRLGFGSVEEIVLTGRLVTGEAGGVGDLGEMTNLVQQDVRRKFAPRHRECAALNGERHPLTCRLLGEPAQIVAEIRADVIGVRQQPLPVSLWNAGLVGHLAALHAREVTPLDEEHVVEQAADVRKTAAALKGDRQS